MIKPTGRDEPFPTVYSFLGNDYYNIRCFHKEYPHIVNALGMNSTNHIIDTLNKKIIGDIYFFDNGPDYFKNGLTRFKKNNRVGYLDKKAKIIVSPAYDYGSYFMDGFAMVGNNVIGADTIMESIIPKCESYGVIDKKGHVILPLIYKNIGSPKDSVIIADGKTIDLTEIDNY
jgi:hypothetical protein